MIRRFNLSKLWALPLIALLAAGCSAANNSPSSSSPAASPSASSSLPASASPSASPSASAPAAAKTSYPLSVDNFVVPSEGGSWTSKTQTFDKAPERIVANTQPVAETLIRLGLADRIVGVAAMYNDPAPDIAEELAKLPVLSKDYVGKEVTVGANPDIIVGRGDLFADADWGVGTVDALNELGIKTFVFSTSRPGATMDNMYQDIERLGAIFDVQERSQAYITELKQRVADLQAKLAGSEEKTFAYAFSTSAEAVSVYSGANDTFQSDALRLLKLNNAFGDVTGEISTEQFVAEDPDMLLVSDYKGGPDIDKVVADLYANKALQGMKAIVNKQVYVIDYNDFWGYSYHILDGVEKLAAKLAGQ